MTCARTGSLVRRRGRAAGLLARKPQALDDPVAQPLHPVPDVDHPGLQELHRRRIGRVQEPHRRDRARIESPLALASQEVAHRDRHVAEVDVDRTGIEALVTDGAVVGDVGELVEMPQADAAPRLLLVQESLDQERRRQDLVARAVEQVRARRMRRARRLALAAAQAILDRFGDAADRALLEDQALRADQREARRVRVRQVREQRVVANQLALVEPAFRVDALLVVGEVLQLLVGKKLELRDADAVLA